MIMKVGIWATTALDPHWASCGALKERGAYTDKDERFATTDLNVAFRYLAVLAVQYSFPLEVKEKP
jgi:hypothetical protein